jgi:hypothetical protein
MLPALRPYNKPKRVSAPGELHASDYSMCYYTLPRYSPYVTSIEHTIDVDEYDMSYEESRSPSHILQKRANRRSRLDIEQTSTPMH